MTNRRRVAFCSSNTTPWGGSEELWATTAAAMASAGHAVLVFKANVLRSQPRIRRLIELSCRVVDMTKIPLIPRTVNSAVARLAYPVIKVQQVARLAIGLRLFRPDLVVISQGGNYDGLLVADLCRRLKLPYVLISQKAADIYWTADSRLPWLRAAYAAARWTYFVSEANLRLTEEQLGFGLPRASVVRNPYLVPWESRPDWPEESDGWRLACVGRLYPAEKGQDILLRVLARDHWRMRPITVTFAGDGPHRDALARMASFHRLGNVHFAGFTPDVSALWSSHHALVLPSRCEGLPLVLVEAMLSGRTAIVTDIGGNGEVIEEGVSGFLASSASEDALDAALERAWIRRDEWRAMGAAAARSIRAIVPADPAGVMAETLLRLIADRTERRNDEPALDPVGSR